MRYVARELRLDGLDGQGEVRLGARMNKKIGKPISRRKALLIAYRILHRAEKERIQAILSCRSRVRRSRYRLPVTRQGREPSVSVYLDDGVSEQEKLL